MLGNASSDGSVDRELVGKQLNRLVTPLSSIRRFRSDLTGVPAPIAGGAVFVSYDEPAGASLTPMAAGELTRGTQ